MTKKIIFEEIQRSIEREVEGGKDMKIVKKYSEVIEERKTKLIGKIIREEEGSILRHVTFRPNKIEPKQIEDREGVRRRAGQPRVRWVETALENLWKVVQKKRNLALRI